MANDRLDGLLLIDKPAGWTSHDVVAKVRNTLRAQINRVKQSTDSQLPTPVSKKLKVGHTGTLDPLATGLMVLVIGSYCKRANEFSKLDKTYKATIKLGETSSTGDAEGEIVSGSSKIVDKQELKKVLEQFIGEISQTPPAYSAVKIDGQRAYKLAREGKKADMKQRRVTIHDISEISYQYPFISFMVSVSSGTYIRSLAEDIGKKLGTGAYLSALRRVTVGEFSVAKAKEPTEASIDKIQ